MKRIINLLIALLLFTGTQAQVLHAIAARVIGGGSSSYTVLRTFYLNFSRQVGFTATEATSPPWNNTSNDFGTWSTVGAVGKTNMITSTGATSTVSATNPVALAGMGGIDHNNTVDAGVWPDNVITIIASFNYGTGYRFTGLDDTKYYNIYVHFNNHSWESRVVSFTCNGKGNTPVGSVPASGTPQVWRESGGNSGEGHGTGLANTSLDYVYAVQSSGGILNISFFNQDGTGIINVSSIVLEETNTAHL